AIYWGNRDNDGASVRSSARDSRLPPDSRAATAVSSADWRIKISSTVRQGPDRFTGSALPRASELGGTVCGVSVASSEPESGVREIGRASCRESGEWVGWGVA